MPEPCWKCETCVPCPDCDPEKHTFYATRKGVPMGVSGSGWHRICDECGEGPNHAIHKEE